MNRIPNMTMVALAAAMMTSGLRAEEAASTVKLSVDVASAYVFRGATFNDGLVVQPGLEVSGLPITVGVWGNLDIDDYDGALEGGQFSEIDISGSYDVPSELIGDIIGMSVGYCEYTYPGGAAEADRELGVSFSYEQILAFKLDLFYGVDGGIDKSLYAEAGVGYEKEVSDDITVGVGASLGYSSPDEGESGLSHYTIGGSVGYRFLSASLTYIGEIDDDVLMTDVEVVGTVGASMEF